MNSRRDQGFGMLKRISISASALAAAANSSRAGRLSLSGRRRSGEKGFDFAQLVA